MAEIQITTTQNVNLNFKLAELNHRILAWFLDVLVKSSYIGMMVFFLFKVLSIHDTFKGLDQWSAVSLIIIICIPAIFYTLVLETLLGGQTVGKKIMKLKVLKIDGYQTSFIDFFIRWVMRIVDVNMMSGIIALIFIGSSKNSQRLGGISSGTAVVSLRNKINISHTILEENVQEYYKPTYPSVIKLSDNDVRIIKEHFIRAKEKTDHALFLKLKDKILQVTSIEVEGELNTELFIDTVIKDYNHYTQTM